MCWLCVEYNVLYASVRSGYVLLKSFVSLLICVRVCVCVCVCTRTYACMLVLVLLTERILQTQTIIVDLELPYLFIMLCPFFIAWLKASLL